MTGPVSSRKHAAFWTVALAAPATILLLACEIALRLLVPADPPTTRPGRTVAELLAESERTEVRQASQGQFMGLIRASDRAGLVYELKPDREWIIEGRPTRTNSQGFRGREPLARTAGVLRVAGIGDSVAFGWGVGEEETYLRRLEASLESEAGGEVEVLNFAVPGYNTVQEAIVFRERILPLSPDLIVLGYVLNDAEPVLFRDSVPEHPFVAASRLLQLARDVFQEPPRAGVQARQAMEEALRSIGRTARRRGIPALFCIYPNLVRGEDPEIPRRIATQSGFTCVDLHAAFEAYYRTTGRSFRDVSLSVTDAHPNPEGHQLIAEILRPHVAEALASAAGRSPP